MIYVNLFLFLWCSVLAIIDYKIGLKKWALLMVGLALLNLGAVLMVLLGN